MTETTKTPLLDHFEFNPILFLELKDKDPSARVSYLLDLMKKLPSVKGMGNGENDDRLDNELERYAGYLFTAIEEASESWRQGRDWRVRTASELFRWFTDTRIAFTSKVLFPRIPKTLALLPLEMARSWAGAEEENEAQGYLKSLAELYLNTGSELECTDWRQAIRAAVNRTCAECSVPRLAQSLITLSEMTTWNFGESIFDSIAFGLLKKQILTSPAAVVRAAQMALIIGNEMSQSGDGVIMECARSVERIDEAARSFLKMLKPDAWYIGAIDDASSYATLVLDVPDDFDEAHLHAAIDSAVDKGMRWPNPHFGSTWLNLKAINSRGVAIRSATVGGHATHMSSGNL